MLCDLFETKWSLVNKIIGTYLLLRVSLEDVGGNVSAVLSGVHLPGYVCHKHEGLQRMH